MPAIDLRDKTTRWWLGVFGATVAPVLVMSAYFLLSGSAQERILQLDLLALLVCVAIGCVALAQLPVSDWLRVLLVVIYAPIAFKGLILFSIVFVCIAFQDCL